MTVLTRDQILAASDITKELVDVPEWGEGAQVYVKAMTGAERDRYEGSIIVQGKTPSEQTVTHTNARAKLAVLVVCDEKGKRLFTDADVIELTKKSAAALDRIYAVATRLAGISPQDEHELSEALKADPFDGSPSDLP